MWRHGKAMASLACMCLLGCELVAAIDSRQLVPSTGGTTGAGGSGGVGGEGGQGGQGGQPPCPPDSEPGCLLWSARLGDASTDGIRDLVVDGQGNVIVLGLFAGGLDCGGESFVSGGAGHNLFVAKLDPQGEIQWCRHYPSAAAQDSYGGVAVDGNGNIVIAGHVSGSIDFGDGVMTATGADVFVAKLDPAGNLLWAELFGAAGDQISRGVAVDADGNVVVVGYFQGVLDFGVGGELPNNGSADVFLAKLNSSGSPMWARSFGGTEADFGGSVAVDGSKNIAIAGNAEGPLELGGAGLSHQGSKDVFVAKYDSEGEHLWSHTFGGPQRDDGQDIAIDTNNGVVVVSRIEGVVTILDDTIAAPNWNGMVARFDASGAYLTAKVFECAFTPNGIAIDSSGSLIIGFYLLDSCDFGGGLLPAAGGSDLALVKLDGNLTHLWSKSFGGAADDSVSDVGVDSDDNVLAVGRFQQSIDFGAGGMTSAGNDDAFVIKLTP